MIGLCRGIAASARRWRDPLQVEYDGISQMHGLPTPPWKGNSAGAWAFDAVVVSAPPGTGNAIQRILGMGKYLSTGFLQIDARRHTIFGDTDLRLDITTNPTNTSSPNYSNAGITTPLVIGVRYRCLVQSNGTIWVSGVAQSLVSWNSTPWLPGRWMSTLTGAASTYEQGFGGIKLPGQPVDVSGNVRLNNVIYYNAPLTSTEVAQDYNGGISFDRRTIPALASKMVEFWRFDGDGDAEINPANNLTQYGTPTYVAP